MMSFLDEASQDWSRPELQAVRDLFVAAYRHQQLAAVEQLANEAGIAPGTFPIASDLRSTMTQLIEVMGSQRRLRTLVEKAASDVTISASSQRFRKVLEDNPPGEEGIGEEEIPAPVEPLSMAGLAAILAADLPRLAGQFAGQVQRLAASSDQLDASLAAVAAAATIRSIEEVLNSIDDIGLGRAATTPADDGDNALRKEIRQQLCDISTNLLPKAAERHDGTTSVAGLTVAAGHLRASAGRLAGLRARQHRSQ